MEEAGAEAGGEGAEEGEEDGAEHRLVPDSLDGATPHPGQYYMVQPGVLSQDNSHQPGEFHAMVRPKTCLCHFVIQMAALCLGSRVACCCLPCLSGSLT